jgi:hypothetical protein
MRNVMFKFVTIIISKDQWRPLQNAPFFPISASGGTSRQRRAQILIRLRRINPRNTQCIPVVKIFAFPRSKSGIFDLTSNKIKHFSKVSNEFKAKIY